MSALTADTPTAEPGASSSTRAQRVLGYSLLAGLAYIPLILTAPGRVVVDTKEYLYLDPGRLLARAPFLWQPSVHLGSVTHENIGYLFPAGPFYWVFANLGVPTWVAQRLWLGSILFGAGLGVLYLLRTLHLRGPGVIVAALVYMLSPYTLQYASRLSILLIAWSALPWMIALAARSLRSDGWRYPAAFAIVVQLAGSVNATTLLYAGLAPVLWIVHSVWISREVSLARALRTTGRIALLTILTSLWWVAGLSVQAGYGLDVLKYTETIKAVSTAGQAGEVQRGLGYWFFYGGDRLGPWIEAAIDYTSRRWLIFAGYTIPILAMVSAAFIRWRHRVYFVVLIALGVLIAVGAHPYNDPSPFGSIVKSFGEGSTVGLALRSVGRAVPLVVLGFGVLLGVGANLLVRWLARRGQLRFGLAACVLLGILAIVNLPALWKGTFYGDNLQRPETLPKYWTDAIAALDKGSHQTRILELPGADFSAYRWGNTVEPITPGLTDRPYVARELVPYGSAASANLLDALDRRLQLGLLQPSSVAPVARLMSVGDVVLRNDLQVDRYDLARPKNTWLVFNPTPTGLGTPTSYGHGLGPPLTLPLLDAKTLALPAGTPDPAPVVAFPVHNPVPVVRADATNPATVVSGDGEGLVDLSQSGLLNGSELLRYSASFAGDSQGLAQAVGTNSVLVVTDSNRKRAERWDNVNYNVGYTQRPGEQPLVKDTSDNQLVVFPGAGEDASTVMEQLGVQVSATDYGALSQYLPASRPAMAFDGDVNTAWTVGAFEAVDGQRIRADLSHPITTGSVNLVQPLNGQRDRYITRVNLHFTDAHGQPVGHDVTGRPRTGVPHRHGPDRPLPGASVHRLEITVAADNLGPQPNYPHASGVGFAEIRLHDDRTPSQDVRVDEVVRMPTDLVSAPAARSVTHPLVYEMTRLRTVLAPPNTAEEEAALVRSFTVPSRARLRARRDRPGRRRSPRPEHRPGARHPRRHRRWCHRDRIPAPDDDRAGPRLIGDRRGPDHRLEHPSRRPHRAVDRRQALPAGDLQPPRPAPRLRRPPLRPDPAHHRRRRRSDPRRRRPTGRHRLGRERHRRRAGQLPGRHHRPRPRHHRRRPSGQHHRVLLEPPHQSARRDRRARHPRRTTAGPRSDGAERLSFRPRDPRRPAAPGPHQREHRGCSQRRRVDGRGLRPDRRHRGTDPSPRRSAHPASRPRDPDRTQPRQPRSRLQLGWGAVADAEPACRHHHNARERPRRGSTSPATARPPSEPACTAPPDPSGSCSDRASTRAGKPPSTAMTSGDPSSSTACPTDGTSTPARATTSP